MIFYEWSELLEYYVVTDETDAILGYYYTTKDVLEAYPKALLVNRCGHLRAIA